MDVSAFDIMTNKMEDLLMVKGGIEQYLQTVEGHMNVPDKSLLLLSVMLIASLTFLTIQPTALPYSPNSLSSILMVPTPKSLPLLIEHILEDG